MLSTAFYTLCSGTSVPWETSGNTNGDSVSDPSLGCTASSWSQVLMCTHYTAKPFDFFVKFHCCGDYFCMCNVANESHSHSIFLVEVGAISFCLPRGSRAQAELSEYEYIGRLVFQRKLCTESDQICSSVYRPPINEESRPVRRGCSCEHSLGAEGSIKSTLEAALN